ncbi:MAG: DUF4293 domain-containing protein [Tannerellaceae bacterium]|jgi:hypothetical protein|nr:DUF4293 domain-containing protein [Tannerellaceae bacterium]
MLQRIQTVYLLIIAGLAVAMMFLPLAVLQRGSEHYILGVFGVTEAAPSQPELIYPVWGLFVLTAIIALLAVVTAFLYKNRIRQIRICVFNAIVMIGFYGFFAFLIYGVMKREIDDLSVSVQIALSFPLISLILDYLAIRNIGADEVLVRSVERLRK